MKSLYAVTIDKNYLARTLCLYRSLEPWLGDSRFGVFCLDDAAAAVLERLDLPRAVIVRHGDFASPALRRLKTQRRTNEYCWTCKSVALQHGLATWPELDWAVYVDADMMAFGDPDTVLADTAAHVVLTPHRFALDHFVAYEANAGVYNAGYVAFRNSPDGRRALDWWTQSCLDLCPAVPTNGVYGDQTYLEQIADRFAGVVASEHRGLNAAPWNIEGPRVELRQGRVHCGDDPLLLYHFQGLRLYGSRLYDMYAGPYRLPADAVRHIYRPHLRALSAALREVRGVMPEYAGDVLPFLTAPKTIYHQLRRLLTGTNNLSLVFR